MTGTRTEVGRWGGLVLEVLCRHTSCRCQAGETASEFRFRCQAIREPPVISKGPESLNPHLSIGVSKHGPYIQSCPHSTHDMATKSQEFHSPAGPVCLHLSADQLSKMPGLGRPKLASPGECRSGKTFRCGGTNSESHARIRSATDDQLPRIWEKGLVRCRVVWAYMIKACSGFQTSTLSTPTGSRGLGSPEHADSMQCIHEALRPAQHCATDRMSACSDLDRELVLS